MEVVLFKNRYASYNQNQEICSSDIGKWSWLVGHLSLFWSVGSLCLAMFDWMSVTGHGWLDVCVWAWLAGCPCLVLVGWMSVSGLVSLDVCA